MMKQLLFIFLVMFGSVSMSHYLLKDPGYVLIQFQSWRVESSLITMIILISLSLLIIFLAIHLLKSLLNLPSLVHRWQTRRQEKRFKQGINAFFKGEWALTLQKLKHSPKRSSWPLDLISAQAAQNQGLIRERDQFLQMAARVAPKEQETILMFQAQLQIAQGQFEQAQATLTHIRYHRQFLSPQWRLLQAEVELHFKNHQAALDLLKDAPILQKELRIYRDVLSRSLQGLASNNALPSSNDCIQFLKQLDAEIQDDFSILMILAPRLSEEKSNKKWLMKKIDAGLKQIPLNPHLLLLLQQIELDTKSFQKYETLLSGQAQSPEIYLTLAKMKSKQNLWGAALHDLNHAISANPSKDAYSLMAEIYLRLNQNSNALDAMQRALNLT